MTDRGADVVFCTGIYELPLFYQAKGHSATKSGIDILPFMLTVVLGAGLSGAVIGVTGRYWWWLVASPLLGSIGSGLLFTLDVHTRYVSWITGWMIWY